MSALQLLRTVVLKNMWLKLLALALAIVTWFYIDTELQDLSAPPSHQVFDTSATSQD